MKDWKIFTGNNKPSPDLSIADLLPAPPPWRIFGSDSLVQTERTPCTEEEMKELTDKGSRFQIEIIDKEGNVEEIKQRTQIIEMVNAALFLRRPLLITGKPGTGKTSLIYAVAHELNLGTVLEWPITSRSTLQLGKYSYDAIGRLEEQQRTGEPTPISDYLQLGPLGTAFLPTKCPRALLIDEIDKSDIDLPNDLLHIFEQGKFVIPELERLKNKNSIEIRECNGNKSFPITNGEVRCHEFPFVVMTSNGEREFPPAFLRRCLQLHIQEPSAELLKQIIEAHLGKEVAASSTRLINEFVKRRTAESLATDQLLNAIYLVRGNCGDVGKSFESLVESILKALSTNN